MHILSVKDPAFRKYGRVITNVDFTQLVEEMKKTPVPDGVIYEPGINALEALPVKKELETITYGEMPVQIGYCNGHNSKLNAVEYHRSSEINVAATDAIEAEVRLYDRLFKDEDPAGHKEVDFKEFINEDSLRVLKGCKLESSMRRAKPGDRFQFQRLGYFCVDPDSTDGQLVINRTVSLKDTWQKMNK